MSEQHTPAPNGPDTTETSAVALDTVKFERPDGTEVVLNFDNPSQVHPKVRQFWAQKGCNHTFANVVDSKVVAKIKKVGYPEVALKDFVPNDKRIAHYRETNKDTIALWTNEAIDENLKAVADGTLGMRASGPRVSDFESRVIAMAKEQVRKRCADRGWVIPFNARATLMLDGMPKSFGELVEMSITKNRVDFEAKIAQEMEEARRLAAQAATAAGAHKEAIAADELI